MSVRLALAIAVLVVGGGLLRPAERALHAARAAAGFGALQFSADVRKQLPQEAVVGVFAGFNGLVADFIWIKGHGHWEKKEWLRQYTCLLGATFLQPKSVLFWDVSAWHMAWNIAYAARTDPENRTKAEGIKREREWQGKARAFLAEGLRHNPERYDLYFASGWLYWKKLKQPCVAKDYFQAAAALPDAPSFVFRSYGRTLEECGDPPAAYALWKRLWRGGQPAPFPDGISATAVITRELRRLEESLQIPDAERVLPSESRRRQDDKS